MAYPYEPRPERFALDLAIQATGCFAVPVGPGEVELPVGERELWEAADAPAAAGRLPWGGSLARAAARGGVVAAGRPVPADELLARTRRLEAQISGSAGGGREIAVAVGPLADPAERDLVAWATLTGAALVLEPAADRLVDTAAWARPTVFLGSAEETRRLLDRADAADREGWAGVARRVRRLTGRPAALGLPFGRLHAMLLRSPHPPSADLEERARSRGVALSALPLDTSPRAAL